MNNPVRAKILIMILLFLDAVSHKQAIIPAKRKGPAA